MKEFVAGVIAFAVGAGVVAVCLGGGAPANNSQRATASSPPRPPTFYRLDRKKTPEIERLENIESVLGPDWTWGQGAEWVLDGCAYPYTSSVDGAGNFDVAVPYVFGTKTQTAHLRTKGQTSMSFELKPNGVPAPKINTVTVRAGPYRVIFKPRPIFSPALPLIYEVTASGPHRGVLYGVTLYRVAPASESQEYSGVRCGREPGLQVIPDWNTGQYTINVSEVRQDLVELRVDRKEFGHTTLFNLKDPNGRIVYSAKGDSRYGELVDATEDPHLGGLEWKGHRLTYVDPLPVAWQYRRHESEPNATPYMLEDLKDGQVAAFTRFRGTPSPSGTSAPFSLGLPPRTLFGNMF